ncbi:MAG: response regulator [Anaerolineales bacterium]|jgi:PleD family two-component response regulator
MAQTKENATLLIIEDDLDVAEMLNAYFRVLGYEVTTVNWGADALRACETSPPDLIISDVNLPDIDGFEIARRLQASRRTRETPIIFLTVKRAKEDVRAGLGLGVVDYITKPFDIQELRLRVRNALARSRQPHQRHTVTNLPDANLVDARLREMLSEENWAVLLVALSNLHHFRDEYGFIAADDVLRAISLMIVNTVRDAGGTNDFLGHLGGMDFIIITTPEAGTKLRRLLVARLSQSIDYFYPMRDRDLDTGRLISDHDIRLSIHVKLLQKEDGPFGSILQLKERLGA